MCSRKGCGVTQDQAKHRSSRSDVKAGEDAGSTGKADAKRSKPMSADADPPTPSKRARAESQTAGKRQVLYGST